MKNIITFLCFLMSSTFLAAQSEVMELTDFDVLDASTGVKVTLYQGEPRAEIKMIKGEREDLVIENKNGKLKIRFKSKKWGMSSNNRKAEIKLYTNELRGVEVSAGARVIGHDAYENDKFNVEVSSGGSLDMEITSDKLSVEVSSGGSAKLEGKTDMLKAEVSSGGSLSGAKMQADEVTAESSSGGSAKVWALSSLKAEASSGGSIKYKGNPKHKDLESSKYSGGSIRQL